MFRPLLFLRPLLVSGCLLFGGSLWGQTLLTMDKAMEIAQKNSPDLRVSGLNLERYRQSLIAQKASLKSQFSLNLDPVEYSQSRDFDKRVSQWYTNKNFSTGATFRVDQPILFTDGTISLINSFGWQNNESKAGGLYNTNKAFRNNLYLQLDQPLFTYNQRKVALKEIENSYENAAIGYALQCLQTELQITTQFYTVYTAQNSLAIAKEELTNARQNYEIIRDKVEADLVAREELYQAEINQANAQSSLDNSAVTLENAKDKLKQLLGMPLSEEIQVVAEFSVEAVEVNLEQAIQNGLNSRLELRQREIEIDELQYDMLRTKASNEFKGNLGLSFGFIGDDEAFGNIYQNPTQNPRAVVSFTVPLFDWGERRAKIRAQETAQRIAQLNYQEDKIDIESNIRQTWRSLLNLRGQIKIAEQSVSNAQRTYDLKQIRYREGELSGMEMNQFQTQLSSEKSSYIQQLINYRIELLNMKILSLYDFEKGVPVVPMIQINTKTLK